MKITRIITVIAAAMSMGCSQKTIPEDIKAQINEIVHDISQPDRTDWREKTDLLFADIEVLVDARQRIACLRCFADNVLETDVSAPDIQDKCRTAGAVISLCRDSIISQMRASGGTIEDAWDVMISLFTWMRTQTDKLYDQGRLPDGITRSRNGGLVINDYEAGRRYRKRHEAYVWIAGSYDNRLATAESRFPDRNDGKIDESRIPALKEKIERFLGRPMRTPEQCRNDREEKKSELREWPE